MSAHPAMGRSTTPFAFPFAPLGFSLFDTDPSRILSMLHHQTLLAEEALRYRGLLFSTPKDPIRFSSISEILSSKEHQDKIRSNQMYKTQFNNNINNNLKTTNNLMNQHRYFPMTQFGRPSAASAPPASSTSQQNRRELSILEELKKRSEETVQKEEAAEIELNLNDQYKDSTGSLNFTRRNLNIDSQPQLIDATGGNIRYLNPDLTSLKEKSSSTSTSPTPPPGNKSSTSSGIGSSLSFTSLYDSDPIEEETHCVHCNANFPNVWLLEQHAALQHPADPDDKPFICEQCGQSYRYRSAYAKHKEQNHRARLPADKLFTCDVCGMQFRYLKSFKKHRLNHALERLHGKKERKIFSGENQDLVTSTNESAENEVTDLRINIKREKDDEDQDSTVDSVGTSSNLISNFPSKTVSPRVSSEPKITSSAEGVTSYSTNDNRPRILSPIVTEPESSSGVAHYNQMPQYPTASAMATTSISSIASLINAERLPNEQLLGLNPQEASILNFLRVDAAERQRDKRNPASRFACPFCGKCVRSKENLKLHVRKHTGERPFVCLFCGRAFGGKSDLTRHLRIHTGERPYHCESCGKCFARADYLSKHLTTHIHNAPR